MSMEKLLGEYVIVRCKSSGVYAGVLESAEGRTAILTESRQLHYWRADRHSAFLSGVAVYGLAGGSCISEILEDRQQLFETCEIIACSATAERNIRTYNSTAGSTGMTHLGEFCDGGPHFQHTLCGREGKKLRMIPMTDLTAWYGLTEPARGIKVCRKCQAIFEGSKAA